MVAVLAALLHFFNLAALYDDVHDAPDQRQWLQVHGATVLAATLALLISVLCLTLRLSPWLALVGVTLSTGYMVYRRILHPGDDDPVP